MNPSVLATEGWIWARAAKRRLVSARSPFADPFEEADHLADLGQGIEALDRSLRYADRVLKAVRETSLPAGIDWDGLREFSRRGRDALAHGDERLTNPGLGYSIRFRDADVEIHGKAKGDVEWQTDRIPVDDLKAGIDALEVWLDRESSFV